MFAHVHPGDCSAAALRQSGVPGSVHVWSDVLHEGPLTDPGDDAARRRVRAGALFPLCGGAVPLAALEARLAEQDDALARAMQANEIVLWFDACLYDQLILVHLLNDLGGRPGSAVLSVVCIGEHEAVPRFTGLGQLAPLQFASLFSRRVPVSSDQFDLARESWRALTDADPRSVERLAASDPAALPFLREALLRLLEQHAAPADGLNRTDRAILDLLAESACSPTELFTRLSDLEARPFFGDTLCYYWLRRLAELPRPLVSIAGPGPLPLWKPPPDVGSRWQCLPTPDGLAVQAGRAHAWVLNPPDFWVGGVHVTPGNPWAYDRGLRRMVRP